MRKISASCKLQAASCKLQAASCKLQVISSTPPNNPPGKYT